MSSKCLIKNKQGKCAKNITIIGRRWFERTYGNTYHSVEVFVDGEKVGEEPFAYGYGDQYIDSAHKILKKNGLAPKVEKKDDGGYWDFIRDTREHRNKYVISVSDVERKKDL